MRNKPRLAIGIPVYNGARFIDQLLHNLREQSFADFEIVVSDNGSTDRTRDICLKHARADDRIRYVRSDVNVGANPNFDKAFALTSAPYFKWAAHDDLYAPTFLEKCVGLLDANPDVVLAHSGARYVNAHGGPLVKADRGSGTVRLRRDPISSGESSYAVVRFADVLFRNSYCHEIYGVFRRSALEKTRLLDRNYYASDKALLLEVTLLGRYLHVREPLFVKRYHEGMSGALSMEDAKKWANSEAGIYSWRLRKLADYLSTPRGKPITPLGHAGCVALVCVSAIWLLATLTLRRAGLLAPANEVLIAALAPVSGQNDGPEPGRNAA